MTSPNRLKRTCQDAGFQNSLSSPSENWDGTMLSQLQPENPPSQDEYISSVHRGAIAGTTQPMIQSSIVESSLAGDATPAAALPTISKSATINKRRKLTPAEQEARRLEKEAKDRQRADEKAKLEESRRAQLRLNSFFGQPPAASDGPSAITKCENHTSSRSRRSSLSSNNNVGTKSRSRSASRAPVKAPTSEYERSFPPFFVQSHTNMAPQNQFSRDEHSLKYAQARIDEGFPSSIAEGGSPATAFDPFTLLHLSPHRRSGVYHRRRFSVKEIVERIHGTARKPIDLTESGTNSLRKPTQLLKYITTKYLKFAEDVRPPYIGTYTKITDQSAASKLRRNPFAKILPTTDYGYDSEAEWEDPGEGEDLDSEGEEEAGEDEDGDEMEGFLDDEDGGEIARAANLKHRPLNEDLEPSCTGLCWENASDPECWSSAEAKVMVDLRLEILSDSFHPPIDPYSTIYWQPSSAPSNPLPSSMDPPRLPLTTINRVNTLIPNGTPAVEDNLKVPSRTEPTMVTFPPKGPKRMIAADLMTAFEAAVQGSDLTKAGLIEVLKKQFPTQTKDAIKDTLNLVAKRVGTREADKRWVIKEEHLSSVTPGM